ncbi:hypothetical protein [Streptomyces flaveolus]|uniref:hypothetical protein n=1 Tax=Streptomyces flaveolus TaxID=67297 RepID=UPI003D9E1194
MLIISRNWLGDELAEDDRGEEAVQIRRVRDHGFGGPGPGDRLLGGVDQGQRRVVVAYRPDTPLVR